MQPKLTIYAQTHSSSSFVVGIESVDNYIVSYINSFFGEKHLEHQFQALLVKKGIELTGKEFRIHPIDAIHHVDQTGQYYHPMFKTVWEWFRKTSAGKEAPRMDDIRFLLCGRGFTCLKGYINLTLCKLEQNQSVYWPCAHESLHYSVVDILCDLGCIIVATSSITSIEELCVHNDENMRKLAEVKIRLQNQQVG